MRHSLAIVFLCLLPACVAPVSPAQTVFSLEASYDAAINVAIVYASLPRCIKGGPVLCSEPKLVRDTNTIAHQTWTAIRAAEIVARAQKPDPAATAQALAAAQAALAALRARTDNMKVS